MAWRIDEQVDHGELDNRARGQVTGRIWLVGRDAPVELDLVGNCWRDLAGLQLIFANREPKPGPIERIASRQKGVVGDITASRKVKVPDIPIEQIGAYEAAKKPWPWHWGNALHLEWFSQTNGRVIIETAAFDLRIVGDATWAMSAEEENQQRRANGEALTGFMNRLAGADGPGIGMDEDEEEGERPDRF